MIPFIFLIITAVLIFLVMAFIIKNYALGMISAMAMMVVGVYVLAVGIESIDNILTMAIGIILICIGGYIFICGTILEFQEV